MPGRLKVGASECEHFKRDQNGMLYGPMRSCAHPLRRLKSMACLLKLCPVKHKQMRLKESEHAR